MINPQTDKENIQLLKSKGLRVTDIRMEMIRVFEKNKFALAHSDLEKMLGNSHDRVTIYRTLTSFFEKGLLHKVPDESGLVRYALCHHDHHEELHEHSDNHVHFLCKKCESTRCFDHLLIPDVIIPKGFKVQETTYLIKGICADCSRDSR